MRGKRTISLAIITMSILVHFSFFNQDSTGLNSVTDNFSPNSGSNIFYVSPSGSTYTSIQDAIDACSDNDVIIIGNGTYEEKIIIKKDNIKLIGNSSNDCIIKNDYEQTISITNDCNNMEIIGIRFVGSNDNTTMISINGNNTNIINCKFHLNGYDHLGIKIDSIIKNLTVKNSSFKILGNRSHGIMMDNKSQKIRIFDDSFFLVGRDSSGIYCDFVKDIIIRRCNYNVSCKTRSHEEMNNYGIIIKTGNDIEIEQSNFNLDFLEVRQICYGIGSHENHAHDTRFDKSIFLINNLSIHDCFFDMYFFNYGTHIKYVNNFTMYNIFTTGSSPQYNTPRLWFRILFSKNAKINNTYNITLYFSGYNIEFYNNYGERLLGEGRNIKIFNNTLFFKNSSFKAYSIKIEGKDIDIRNNKIINKICGGVEANGDNITIYNNSIYIQVLKNPNSYYSGIKVDSYYSGGEYIFSNRVNITNNTIIARGNRSYDNEYSGAAGLWVKDLSYGVIKNNIIKAIGNSVIGTKIYHSNGLNIKNNTINTNGLDSVTMNLGDSWKTPTSNLYIHSNNLYTTGSKSICMKMEGEVKGNIIKSNSAILKSGDARYIYAVYRVNQTVSFSYSKEINILETEAVVDDNSKIKTVGLSIDSALVSPDSELDVMQELKVGIKDYDGSNYPYADYRIENRQTLYATPGYGGSLSYPGEKGYVGPFTVWDREYDGSSNPTVYKTNISVTPVYNWNDSVEMNIHENTYYEFLVPNFTRPDIPRGLRAQQIPGTQSLNVSWNMLTSNCKRYEVQYRIDDKWEDLGEVDQPRNWIIHSGLDQDQRVHYRIRSYNGLFYSNYSNPVLGIAGDITPPKDPAGLEVVNISHDRIDIKWDPSMDLDHETTTLWINIGGTENRLKYVTLDDPDVTEYVFNDLKQNTEYDIFLMFRDDIGLASNTAMIKQRTENMTTSVTINVTYEYGTPLQGPASNLRVELSGENYTQPSGYTDNNGSLVFDDIHIPDSISVSIDPPTDMAGIEDICEGYLEIDTGPYFLMQPSDNLTLDLTMEYFEFEVVEPSVKGRIFGYVYYPDKGPLAGDAVNDGEVVIMSDGEIVSTLVTGPDGDYELDDIDLPFDCILIAYPPENAPTNYNESQSHSVSLTGNENTIEVTVTLGYVPGDDEDPEQNGSEYASIVNWGPVGSVDDPHVEIWIEFSHPISEDFDYDWIIIDPLPPGMMGIISADGKTVTIMHEGLTSGITYNVTVYNTIPFGDVNSFSESISWEFTVEEENDPVENGGISPLLIVILILVVVAGVSVLVFFIVRKNRSTDTETIENGNFDENET